MTNARVLISGGGIAGLTLAILLKQKGFDPLVVEIEPAPSRQGYMMDFFGTGWDVAERMGLVADLRAIRYPIERMEFVNAEGRSTFTFKVDRLRRALSNNYVYLRRSDLELILYRHAQAEKIDIRFGTTIDTIAQRDEGIDVRFNDGREQTFSLAFGADGVHSNLRDQIFGPARQFEKFLGYYAAAFHFSTARFPVGNALKLYEEPERTFWLYPLDEKRGDATLIFRHKEMDGVPKQRRLTFLREQYRGAGWIAQDVLASLDPGQPVFFDSLSQVVMPEWHRGRVALLGDACGCLTLAAGQGSHMAMAGAFVLAKELGRHTDHRAAFAAYQAFLQPHVIRKQRDAARFARLLVPSRTSWAWLRNVVIRVILSAPVLKYGSSLFGAKSVLPADD